MNKKTKVALLVGIPVLIGGYLIYKYMRGSKTLPIEDEGGQQGGGQQGGQQGGGQQGGGQECSSHTVVTQSSNLNIRQSPNTSSAIIGSLPKGSLANAKPSSTSGWMQLCDRAGYVSSQYLA
jgi:uncharacterized protein YgiM (DUF1202 family)